MTNEEKRFKIEKIEKYNEEMKDERKLEVNYAFCTCVAAISLFMIITKIPSENITNLCLYIKYLTNGFGIAWLVFMLKNFIQSICKHTILKLDVEKLEEELKALEIEEILKATETEESKGMKR